MASEPESDLRDTVDNGGKKPVNVNPGKTELILSNCLYNSGAINVNMDAFFFAKKYFSKW